MITIRFNRQTGLAQYRGFAASGSNPYYDVCRQMLDANHPDTPAAFVDERGKRSFTVKSIHACARHYRPTPADREAKRERHK